MQLFTLTLLAATALAYPGQLLSKRALTEADIDKRTGCPGTLQAGEYEFPHVSQTLEYSASVSEPCRFFGRQTGWTVSLESGPRGSFYRFIA